MTGLLSHLTAALLAAALSAPALAAPTVFPTGTTIYRPQACWNGYTLLVEGFESSLIDMNGRLVRAWEKTAPRPYGWPARMFPGGDILKVTEEGLVQADWEGKVVWRLPWKDGERESFPLHHDWQRQGSPVGYHAPGQTPLLRGGKTLLLRFQDAEAPGISPRPLLDCVITEVDWDGRTLWTWSFNEHFEEFGFDEDARRTIRDYPNMHRPTPDSPRPPRGDLWHANSLSWVGPNRWAEAGDSRFDPENVISVSREQNILFIASRKTGRIVWRVGPDFGRPELKGLGQMVGPHHAHMIPKGLPGAGNILVFDNGGFAGYGRPGPGSPTGRHNARRHFSRVLEFDPVSFALVWSYTASMERRPLAQFFSAQMSSAQRLPNGNTLITEGDTGRVFEVTPGHKTVWEHVSSRYRQVYRAYRVPYDWVPGQRRPEEVPVTPPPSTRDAPPQHSPFATE